MNPQQSAYRPIALRFDLPIFEGLDPAALSIEDRTTIAQNVSALLTREREWGAKMARGLLEQAQTELAQLRWLSGLIAVGAAVAGFILGTQVVS